MKKKMILISMSFGFVLSITGCGTVKIINLPNQTISKPLSDDNIYKAVQRAGNRVGWMIKKVDKNNILATLYSRKHVAIVNIRYSEENYSIYYKSSQQLKYNAEENTIDKKYNSWVENLDNAIKVQLSLL